MRTNNPMALTAGMALLVACFTLTLFSQGDMSTSQKVIIRIPEATQVGNLLLEPGRYEIQHVVENFRQHYMVFSKAKFMRGSKVLGRVPCTSQPLGEKVRDTEVLRRGGAITEIRIEGEEVTHTF